MLRPSRPMMRPFISSLGSAITETVRSATNSPASRSISPIATTRFGAANQPPRAPLPRQIRMCLAASVRAEFRFISSISERLASYAREAGDGFELGPSLVDMRLQYFFLVGETFSHAHADFDRADSDRLRAARMLPGAFRKSPRVLRVSARSRQSRACDRASRVRRRPSRRPPCPLPLVQPPLLLAGSLFEPPWLLFRPERARPPG